MPNENKQHKHTLLVKSMRIWKVLTLLVSGMKNEPEANTHKYKLSVKLNLLTYKCINEEDIFNVSVIHTIYLRYMYIQS